MPLARGVGGSEFLGQFLTAEAELELGRGNAAAARQALRETIEIATEEDSSHLIPTLPSAARLLPSDELARLLDRVRPLPPSPLNDAYRAEAEAALEGDPARFVEAAVLYREVEMPFEEARCLAAGGDEVAPAAILERLGIPSQRGPE